MAGLLTLYHAPPDTGSLSLGRTLPSLLDEACDRYPNDHALNQWQKRRWQSLSNGEFRTAAEEFALGLLSFALQRGDRVAFVMHSDLPFCITDMGCLLAGLVDVPIDLTQTIENILVILQHSDAKILVISNVDLFYQIAPHLQEAPSLQAVLVVDVPGDWEQIRRHLKNNEEQPGQKAHGPLDDDCLHEPQIFNAAPLEPVGQVEGLPSQLQIWSLDEVRTIGRERWSEERLQSLREAIAPSDLATILYIASETKRPRGVMLSHENISADILSAFSCFPGLETGEKETALLFLPLTHIFARAFFYGHLAYGHSIYFSDPNHIVKHLKTVNPTILITVPRLIEKIYERILEQGKRLQKFDRAVFTWALKVAQRYELGEPPKRLYGLQLKLADRLVFSKWRVVFGDRMKALICGGAALRPDLANALSAAGIPLLQGYGLTETSAVLCYNRGSHNRAGTVGVPIPGVEIAIAPDCEVLIRGPFVMQGYYRDAEATKRAIDSEGWLHTGDLGEITPDGFLRLTGVKKSLFKLSTGKYVSALPLEQELNQSPLISHAVIVGANHKFCALLIFPNLDWVQRELTLLGAASSLTSLQHPCLLTRYQALIDAANCHLPYWSTVRKFKLIPVELTIENGFLNADGTLNRAQVLDAFASEIGAFYSNEIELQSDDPNVVCPPMAAATCPAYAQSLTHY
ncbi:MULTISPECIES: AMP-binding protein [unclassified Leptolyngbya]|uniref:AMP-dependent synthetase/ligase n=1 Tax=unclassified Leptolyngbya TaxID=2650499 RepID=UPI00168A0824|nr:MULTISPECIES: AMP-binding protein [unclassified Leptolyngbya]MBD1910491.1 AMP-binding protein [Leptolyngbya sp. FACHB-8]MBD2153658.1 AMP-binding protein [Leptolyngbya sp. FACHB-16]